MEASLPSRRAPFIPLLFLLFDPPLLVHVYDVPDALTFLDSCYITLTLMKLLTDAFHLQEQKETKLVEL